MLIATLLLAWARPAEGQWHGTLEPDRSALDRVVEDALANNLGLAQASASLARAEAEVREARARYFPALTLSSRYSEQSGTLNLGDLVNPVYGTLNQLTGTTQFPTDLDLRFPFNHESRLRLVQPVFNAQIRAAHAASTHGYAARTAERRASARTLAAGAQTAFLQVGAARAVAHIWANTLPLVTEAERVAQRLVDAGSATPDAVLRARAERSDVEQSLQEAEAQADAAERAFNRLLDRALDTPVDSIAELALRIPVALSLDETVAHALAHREELSALDEGVGAAEASVRLATSSLLPDLAVAVDYGFQGRDLRFKGDNDFWVASLALSWNVFSGGQTLARRDAAQADVRRARLRREEVEGLIRLEAHQAWEAATVAFAAITTAEDRLEAAARTFRLVRRRYDEGLATPIEFLDARTAFTTAELNKVLTVYRYAIHCIELERAAALRDIAPLGDSSWN
ncbi:MAG: TolC family protein [Gemmatimonadota bacterium]